MKSLLLCLLSSLLLVGNSLAEQLQYQVSYRGLFSAGARIPIADVTLHTRAPGQDAGYLETELGVTSQEYGAVEAFYPIRYRLRSWYLADRSTCLAAEYYEHNIRKGAKHRLIYLDDPRQPFVNRDVLTEGELDLPQLRDGSYRLRKRLPSQLGRFDRLGLLQRVRGLALAPGMSVAAQVSNGKKMLEYRVTVESRETVEVAGRNWDALKVRFEGFKDDRHEKPRPAHRPIFIWVSEEARHITLRAVSRHSFGRLSIDLQQVPGETRLVRAGS